MDREILMRVYEGDRKFIRDTKGEQRLAERLHEIIKTYRAMNPT